MLLKVEYESNQKKFESVFSRKVRAGKRRTYFFDVRRTKGNDFYVTLTESTRKFEDGGYERHKIFLYKEDFNRFLDSLQETIDHVKNELMPDYDYDEFTRRQEEYEARRKAEALEENNTPAKAEENDTKETEDTGSAEPESEDDMSW
ncbi:MAG: DUF3276 family protein [Bacteroidetes bacterium]|nr:MAG: DUF3276 family protein [Bacteroidota bacterium]